MLAILGVIEVDHHFARRVNTTPDISLSFKCMLNVVGQKHISSKISGPKRRSDGPHASSFLTHIEVQGCESGLVYSTHGDITR